MRGYVKKEKQEKENRYSLLLLPHMFLLSCALFVTENERKRHRESMIKVVNAHKLGEKEKKSKKNLYIFILLFVY